MMNLGFARLVTWLNVLSVLVLTGLIAGAIYFSYEFLHHSTPSPPPPLIANATVCASLNCSFPYDPTFLP